MSIKRKIWKAYDSVHAPEDVAERMKQELYQMDWNHDAEHEIYRIEPAPRPQFGRYLAYIAAVALVCTGMGLAFRKAQEYRNEFHPGAQVMMDGDAVLPEGTVPDVAQYHFEYAKKIVEQEGYQTELRYETSEAVTAGKVIRTEPAAGKALSEGATVTLIVSRGEPEGNAAE